MPVVLSDGRSVPIERGEVLTNPSLAISSGGGSIDLLRVNQDVLRLLTNGCTGRSRSCSPRSTNSPRPRHVTRCWSTRTTRPPRLSSWSARMTWCCCCASRCRAAAQYRWTANLWRSLYVHGHALGVEGPGAWGRDDAGRVVADPVDAGPGEAGRLRPVQYDITVNGNTYTVGPQEVLHFRLLDGRSPLVGAAAVDRHRGRRRHLPGLLPAQRHRPAGGVQAPRAANQRVDMLRAELRKMYAGPENAGGVHRVRR